MFYYSTFSQKNKKDDIIYIMNILLNAFVWQFFDVPMGIIKGWKNFLLFGLNYFSVPTLLRTYFSYWRKYHSPYGNAFEFWKNFEAFIFNLMSRIAGALLRTFFIISGIILELAIFVTGFLIFIIWLMLPFLLLISLIFGIYLLL